MKRQLSEDEKFERELDNLLEADDSEIATIQKNLARWAKTRDDVLHTIDDQKEKMKASQVTLASVEKQIARLQDQLRTAKGKS